MNNIYKVIWSKAKNCYVVASEIARSHTKSASGTEKIGGTRRKLLASLMALSLLCGGLGVANAADGTVHVEDIAATTISKEVYTAGKVDTLLAEYGKKTDVDTNKDDIAALKTTTTDQGQKITANTTQIANNTTVIANKIDTVTANATYATKDALNDLKDTVNGKADEDAVTTALDSKADTDLSNLTAAGITKIKNTMSADIDLKADKNTVTALEGRVGGVEGKVTTLAGTVGDASNGLVKDVADLNTKNTQISYDAAKGTTVNGVDFKAAEVDANGKGLTGVSTLHTTGAATIGGALTAAGVNAGTEAITGGSLSVTGAVTGNRVDAGAGEIKTTGLVNAGTLSTTGDATVGGDLNATGKVSGNGVDAGTGDIKGGSLSVTGALKGNGVDAEAGEIKTTGVVNAGTLSTTGDAKVGGALGVTGATTLEDALTAKGEATFKAKVTMENDLEVKGELKTDKISMKNTDTDADGWKHDSATTITADGITHIGEMEKSGVIKKSQFTHTEEGSETYATDKDGNKTYTKVTATENSFQVQDKDGKNKNHQVNTKDSSVTEITNGDGKTTKTEQTATDITNTAKDGTIKNDAQTIVNNATGDMTNTVGGNQTNKIDGNQENTIGGDQTTTVKGDVKEDYKKNLTTTVGGNELHEVTGTKTENVNGKVTENYKAGQETNVTGDQDINVSGTQTTTATDINRNASSGMIDTVENASGSNKETKVAGQTTTDVKLASGEEGHYIRGATESRDYLLNGTLKNSETKTAEATSSEITDGTNTASTRQDAKNLAGSVTNGTETGVSGIHANDDGSVSIDSGVTDGSMSSVINQKKDSITSAVGDGISSTVILQDKDNVTIASSNGTVAIGGKDIVNNAQDTITNKAKNITNEATEKLTDKVGDHIRVLDSEGITDTVGGSTFKQRIDAIMMESKDVSIKAEETLTNEAKVITNKASEVINNEAININNTATGIITSKASEIKNQANTLISNQVGENTWENMEDGKISTSIKDGTKQNLTQSDAAGTTQSTVDGAKSTVTIQNADGLADAVTDGTNISVQNQTASAIAAAVKDGVGNENASVATATTSANTIKSGSKANTVISTADGTRFINSEANTAFEGGTYTDTTIKGNTITTGKVTMDYAEVMKDLGVKGTTTTKTLKVTEDAEVGRDLAVGGNATITGDVTANSYKVGDKTYISAAGINANDQKITNVADGSISEGSKDAVNGGQLYGVKRDLEHQVDKVGANAAAMANLRPMEFDPSSKWNIAAAIGNYGSETAAALGAFYRPNDDVMVNLSTAFGTGENMVGGGVSVRLGKGSNKLSREESNALKDQVDDLTARMDALLSVLNPNMSKDFPDVPGNHWAYEAVSRLAGNDIVQGYPDGEFHGERTMTRYEMAEIIYNALSRGAETERELVEEFKPELQAMAASEKATAEKAEG